VAGEITLNTVAGAITVNRYVIHNRGTRAIVLYWYQTSRRVIASEWDAKFWLAVDALRDKRTDTAIVRVAVAIRPAGTPPRLLRRGVRATNLPAAAGQLPAIARTVGQ